MKTINVLGTTIVMILKLIQYIIVVDACAVEIAVAAAKLQTLEEEIV
jgi:hypothetical protein